MRRLHQICKVCYPTFIALIAVILLAGCSKKSEQSNSAAAPATAAPSAETASADAAAQPAPGPALDSSQMIGDAKTAMAEADAANRQRDYEKAAKILMAIQQAQLNQQQAMAARQQMVDFQRNLANAIANGDPNAQAAAEVLRASHRH